MEARHDVDGHGLSEPEALLVVGDRKGWVRFLGLLPSGF
jgi:hypothetical protein